MESQKKRGAIAYSDEINPSLFEFQDQGIDKLSAQLNNTKSYTTKETTQDNFQELCNAWHELIAKIPFASIPVDVEWLFAFDSIQKRVNDLHASDGVFFHQPLKLKSAPKLFPCQSSLTLLQPSLTAWPSEGVVFLSQAGCCNQE